MKRKLGEICKIVSGSTPKTSISEYWGGNLKWITPAELSDNSIIINDTRRTITELGVIKTGLTLLPSGTVLLSSRAPIGKVAIAGCEMYCNQGFKNLICSDLVNNKYLYWFLKSKTEYLKTLGRGATFKEISKTIVANIEINLPSIAEQERIVRCIETVNDRLSMLKNEANKLNELTKARFVEMFGNDKNIVKKLSEITDVITKGTTPTTVGFSFEDSGINFFKIESITEDHRINLQKVAHVSEECHTTLKRSQLKEGDILFSIAGAIGRTAIIHNEDLPGNTNQALAIIRLKDGSSISKEYLISALESPEAINQYRKNKRGVAQMNLSLQDIGNITVPIPSMAKQNEFEAFVQRVDKAKLAIRQSLEKTQLLFDSLMQEYFA